MANQETQDSTEVNKSDKVKIFAGLGLAAVGGAIEVAGLRELDKTEIIAGPGALALGLIYAICHMPKETRESLKDALFK